MATQPLTSTNMAQEISPEVVGIGKNENFLLWGDPGVGKTHTALTLLGIGPTFLMTVGRMNESKTYYSEYFQKWKRDNKVPADHKLYVDTATETFDFEDPKSAAVGFDNVKRQIESAFEDDAKGINQFSSIIVDNMSMTTDFQINKAIKLSDQNKGPESKGKSTLEKAKELGGLSPADFEWKDVQNMMAKFLSELFATSKNIVIIAHEWEQTVTNRSTKQSDLIAVKPQFVGKQRDNIANLFDNVWRMHVDGGQYYARTVSQSKPFSVIAKTRIGGVIDKDYMNPDLSAVIRKFQVHAAKYST